MKICLQLFLVIILTDMWHGWATRVTCPGLYICQFAGYPGRLRHTWLQTLEADLQPLNHGLNSARQRTLEAARGNGYAPVRGTSHKTVMMMMVLTDRKRNKQNSKCKQI